MSNPQSGFIAYVREALTIGTVIVLAVSVAAVVYGVVDAASDFYGDRLWGNGMLLGPALVVAFSTVQLVWKGDERVIAQWGARVIGLNAIATVLATLAFTITYPLVTVQYGKAGYQYWLGEGWQTIMFPSLLGFGMGLLAGLAGFILVVLPFMAIKAPRQLASANMLDMNPKYEARNTAAGLAMVVLIILVFLIPTLIVGFGGVAGTVGWVLIPVGVGLTIFVGVMQRSDKKRRAAAGVSGLTDLIPDERDTPQ